MADFVLRLEHNDWGKIAAGLETKVAAVVAKTAFDWAAGMKGRVPVDTGTLKNSITTQKLGPMHWRITVGADYGIYVNYGTVNMAAQPFLEPEYLRLQPIFAAALGKVFS